MAKSKQAVGHDITLREAFWVWVKVAMYSFGGPAGQIAVMHKLLVAKEMILAQVRAFMDGIV